MRSSDYLPHAQLLQPQVGSQAQRSPQSQALQLQDEHVQGEHVQAVLLVSVVMAHLGVSGSLRSGSDAGCLACA